MLNKRLLINIMFQVAAVFLVIKLASSEQLDFSILKNLFDQDIILIFILIILSKLSMSFLFFSVMKLITNKKIRFIEITNIFLQGGIVSMLIPGAGLLFKYYKLKFTNNISLAEYSISQSFWSLSSIISYISLAFIFGFLKIKFSSLINTFYLIILLLLPIIIILIFNKQILQFFKFFSNKPRFKNFFIEFKKIKYKFLEKKLFFFIIFVAFFLQALLQCLIFYLAVNSFEIDLSFLNSSFIYISSSILSVITLLNFVGLFEILLTISASLIMNNFMNMAVFGIGYRLLNILSLFLVILFILAINLFLKKIQIK